MWHEVGEVDVSLNVLEVSEVDLSNLYLHRDAVRGW